MVGEIRDAETAGLAIRAALTGHLVLASLHTNNAVSSIARLVNMGIEPYLVGGVLRGVIAQRLVRRVCRECGRVDAPSESARTFFARAVLSVPTAVPKAVGCGACRSTGYQGRTAIAEMFTMDRELERVVSGGGDVSSRLNERGFRTISEIGLDRVRDGATTLEEIEHVVLARRRDT
jgi:type IV pilus assembly protein PilB